MLWQPYQTNASLFRFKFKFFTTAHKSLGDLVPACFSGFISHGCFPQCLQSHQLLFCSSVMPNSFPFLFCICHTLYLECLSPLLPLHDYKHCILQVLTPWSFFFIPMVALCLVLFFFSDCLLQYVCVLVYEAQKIMSLHISKSSVLNKVPRIQ